MTIAVIGAGLMGHGIALTMAQAGHDVRVQDPMPAARDGLHDRIATSLTAMGVADTAPALARITAHAQIADTVANADVVFEAAPEKLDLKKQLFTEIEAAAPDHALLASNTSVIQITTIMDHLSLRDRALGTHWWNPPHIIPLVEVVRTEWTSDSAMDRMVTLLADAGKTPARVEQDVPGFIGNRLQHAMWREAINLVERGICTAQTVDDVVKASFGRRLGTLGPLENADLVGLELTRDIHRQVLFDLDTRPDPSPLLDDLLQQGRTGMATGAGFRDWDPEAPARTSERIARYLNGVSDLLQEPEPDQD